MYTKVRYNLSFNVLWKIDARTLKEEAVIMFLQGVGEKSYRNLIEPRTCTLFTYCSACL